MTNDIRKLSMSVALFVTVVLALVAPIVAGAGEIPPGPSTTLPDPERPSWASDVFVAFRNYMEPATAASADSNELVWDRAIYFGPYYSPH